MRMTRCTRRARLVEQLAVNQNLKMNMSSEVTVEAESDSQIRRGKALLCRYLPLSWNRHWGRLVRPQGRPVGPTPGSAGPTSEQPDSMSPIQTSLLSR